MSRRDIGMHGMRIDPRHYMHVASPRTGDQIAERVGIANEPADILQRNFRGVIGDVATSRKAGGVGLCLVEDPEPEIEVEGLRIVFDQRQLGPARRRFVPCGRSLATTPFQCATSSVSTLRDQLSQACHTLSCGSFWRGRS